MNLNRKTTRLTMTGIFIGLILLLGLTPIGLIPLGFINVTTLCIPVLVGTLVLGLKTGAVLGFAFGAVSTYKAFTATTTLVSYLMAKSPFLVVVMSVVPRLLVPVAAWLVYRLASGKSGNAARAVPFAAAAGSLANTVFYLGLMLLFYVICGVDATPVLALIGGTGLIAGGCEAAAAVIICTPVVLALLKIKR